MKYIAVEGCELEAVSPATGTITVLPEQASTDTFINDKGVYFKEIKFSVSNSNGGGSVTDENGAGTGSILATCEDVLDITSGSDKKAVLEGDKDTSVSISGTASGEPASGTIVVRVKKAGQTDVSVT